MSTFGGLMVEYPRIAIDRFQGPAVLRARAYFLSHAHADHMVGLDSTQFSQRLRQSKHVKLYCSEVTHQFLLTDRRFMHLDSFMVSLPIEEPTTITLRDEINGRDVQVLVTLLAAGHCPGSVMFLFEGDEGNVLYTGDFRFAKGEAVRMLPLHSGNRVKDIKSVYVDTTFCVPEAMYIPSREQSRDVLLDLVEKYIQKSPTHMVRLACKAKYGYEYLFVELSKEFNLKVHVSPVVMAQYERVPDLARHLTTDGGSTQVHACRYVDCSMHYATDVLVVVPSTMWFTSNAGPSDVLKKDGRRHRLCFSFHSSFSEVRDFIGYIRPVNIHANVIPYHCTEDAINERLQDLRRGFKPTSLKQTSVYKPLGQLKKSARTSWRTFTASCANDDDDEDDEFAKLFNSSPPPVKKRKEHQPYIDGLAKQTNTAPESGDFLRVRASKQCYLAMDDSDLSSGELDLYDSAPGQSQPWEESFEGTTESRVQARDCVESSLMEHVPHRLRSPPTGKVLDPDGKRLQRESKRAEIDSWLKYLPDANTMEAEPEPEVDKLKTVTSAPHEKKASPEKANETNPEDEVECLDSRHCSEVTHRDIIALNSSQSQLDKTEEYSVSNSREMSTPVGMVGDLKNPSHGVSVKVEESYYTSDQFSGRFDSRDGNACGQDDQNDPRAIRDKGGVHTNSHDVSGEHEKLIYADRRDNVSLEQLNDNVPVKSSDLVRQSITKPEPVPSSLVLAVKPSVQLSTPCWQDDQRAEQVEKVSRPRDPINKIIIETESHGTVVLSSQGSSTGSVILPPSWETGGTQGTEERSEVSQDASQSQDTFLPSSHGSVVSGSSSDFDIPCTPEGKGLQPERVEAVRAMIARGESVPLTSCKKTIKLD